MVQRGQSPLRAMVERHKREDRVGRHVASARKHLRYARALLDGEPAASRGRRPAR
jgi:hypothetical protein